MPKHTKNFKNGELLHAITLEGQKIIGNYYGPCSSFGIWLKAPDPNDINTTVLIKCLRLSAYRPLDPKGKSKRVVFVFGEPVSGLTKEGLKIIGTYMNYSDNGYAWIKGFTPKSPDHTPIPYKVKRNTISKISA